MTGQNNFPFIINVGNSIIGVTILAMPFCFRACGIILGSLLLLFSTWLTLVSCQLLLKAGITARRRSYSFLAYFTHGAIGKLIVEIGMIGLQIGTLVAQVVIIGDLGPAIVSKALGLQNTDNLRTGLIIFLCLFLGLPLGLLKDVRLLSNTSTLCILFYTFFTFYVIVQALPNLLKGQWFNKVTFWRMEGFFQCLPIFSFAFGCQTQMFIVYDALAEPSLKRMNSIVQSAVNMCALAYLLVGFFANVAFCDTEISGDIINHFAQNSVSDGIKLCFVFSIAVSIPLIVFPCRVSLYNLLFPQHKPKEDLPGSGKIPEFHFRAITVFIIVGSMIIGIMVPNVEFVLGLNGATMGSMICYIFPALFFLTVMASSSEGKWTAKLTLLFGLVILIASTYTILIAQEKKMEAARAEDIVIPGDNRGVDIEKSAQEKVEKVIEQIKLPEENKEDAGAGPPKVGEGERQEPPNPQAPDDRQEPDNVNPKDIPEKIDKSNGNRDAEEVKNDIDKREDTLIDKDKREVVDSDIGKVKDNQVLEKVADKEGENKVAEGERVGEKDKSAQEKEVQEKKIEEKEKEIAEKERKQDEILGKLAEQQEEQQKLILEQKQILEELKQHKEEHIEQEKKEVAANKDHQILQPVQQGGQPLLNQQQGIQQAAQGQFGEQQGLLNQQGIGQQELQNQPMGEQPQQAVNQPMAGQQLQNQPMAGQQLQNQPMAGQQLQNQPIGGQQQILNQQQVMNQPMEGAQQILNPPVQHFVQNQPIRQQQMNGQNILQNQPAFQQGLQNQPVMVQQPGQQAVGQQQQFGIPNDLGVQNHQQVQQVVQQAQVGQPAAGHVDQLVGNLPVQNVQAGNAQGQQPIVPAQQVGNPAGIKQDSFIPNAAGNIQQNIEAAKDQNVPNAVNNPVENGANHAGVEGAVKDDTLKRKRRDVGNEDKVETKIHEQNQNDHIQELNNEDGKVNKENLKDGEIGNIQRDLREIRKSPQPDTGKIQSPEQNVRDNVDDMIHNLKKDIYSDGNRKSPFVIGVGDTNLGTKRR